MDNPEWCYICNIRITYDNCGEGCNFCNRSICEKCYYEIPPYPYLMYGYVCKVCE